MAVASAGPYANLHLATESLHLNVIKITLTNATNNKQQKVLIVLLLTLL